MDNTTQMNAQTNAQTNNKTIVEKDILTTKQMR